MMPTLENPTQTLLEKHAQAARQLPQGKLIIGDQHLTTASGGTYDHTNPATGQVIGTVPVAGASEVAAAVQAARQAFPAWKATPPAARAALLLKLAGLLDEHKKQLATIGALEIGTPAHFIDGHMIPNGIEWMRYYAGWADKLEGQVLESHSTQNLSFSIPEPIGVIACFPGWNFALMSILWKVSAALVAGNTVVIKTTEFTAFSLIRFTELALEAGFPAGVVNFIAGGAATGEALVQHPGIDKISFTGGPGTAKSIMTSAAQNLTPVLFELGGKSASLVFADCDLASVVPQIIGFGMSNAGQVCASPSRILVEDSIYDEFVTRATAVLGYFKIGDPLDPETFVGPMGYQGHCDRVTGIIDQAAQQQMGRLVAGGTPVDGELAGGYYVRPALFADVKPESSLAQQEVFGPVLSVFRFKTEEEAIALANALPYGLSAYAWTNDLKRSMRLSQALHAGSVNINKIQTTSPAVPFGGVGLSGFGKEGGRVGIDEFLHYKTVSIGL